MWSPFGRKAVNVAIVKEDESLAVTPEEKSDELGKFWGKVFEAKQISIPMAEEFLKHYAKHLWPNAKTKYIRERSH